MQEESEGIKMELKREKSGKAFKNIKSLQRKQRSRINAIKNKKGAILFDTRKWGENRENILES